MFLLYNIINIHAAITTIVTMQLTLIAALHLYIIKTYLSSVSTQFHNSYPSLFIQYYLDWNRDISRDINFPRQTRLNFTFIKINFLSTNKSPNLQELLHLPIILQSPESSIQQWDALVEVSFSPDAENAFMHGERPFPQQRRPKCLTFDLRGSIKKKKKKKKKLHQANRTVSPTSTTRPRFRYFFLRAEFFSLSSTKRGNRGIPPFGSRSDGRWLKLFLRLGLCDCININTSADLSRLSNEFFFLGCHDWYL